MDHGNGMEVLVFGFRDVSLTNLLDELVHGPQHVAEISAGLPHACCSCVLVRGTRIYIYIYPARWPHIQSMNFHVIWMAGSLFQVDAIGCCS